jgi:GH15 family glucan-1,4-alpha-glucosidase
MALRIEDYALIGDLQTAALVGRDGSIDWLCLPRFDSGACFAGLLGTPDHGRWRIAPADETSRVSRRYRPDSLVLETDFETASGAVRLVDCMPPRAGAEPYLVRLVVGLRGSVAMQMNLVIRTDYGSIVPWVRRTERGLRAIAGPDTLIIDTPLEMHGENMTTVSDFTVSEGQTIPLVLYWHESHRPPPPPIDPPATVEETTRFWTDWSEQCSYHGPWKDAVLRSLITLKALTYAPTGGIVAAPTTSLPEQLGGVRNWDYRFCWVRDASLTLNALLTNGYTDEALAWREWLLRVIAGTPSQMNIMYGLGGERRLPELVLDWLPGYEGSKPVRTGNAAHQQFQLDVFGEVSSALYLARTTGLPPNEEAWRVTLELIGFLEKAWKQPDEGIWEVRGPRRHFTHSKVMAWLAFDRVIRAVEHLGREGPIERWRSVRREIHEEVCRLGYDPQRNTFVQYYGGKELDASLLMIPMVEFLPVTDPRVQGTVEAIQRELTHDGFVLRYPTTSAVDGLPPGEGAFLPCTFWLVNVLHMLGRTKEAHQLFHRLLDLRNDVGLLAEEYDPRHGRLVGNFPQAFSHVALIHSARRLAGHWN